MSGDGGLPPAALTCAPMHRALAALFTAAALLAVPAAALAQSAGDEQYVDPFQGGEEQPSQQPPAASPEPAPAEPAPAEPAPAEPAPAEPAPAAPAAPSDQGGEVTAVPAQTDAPTLPRTGLPAVLLLAAGYALLLAGVALRRTI
jgi:hypothetical protein